MKKFICAAAVIAVGLCSAVTFGGCKPGEAYVEYTLSEDGTYYIVSGVSGDKRGLKEFVVPEEVDGKPVREIGDGAFFQCYYLTVVTLNDNIEKIGESAFAYCSFSQFTIPDSVTEICYGAFGACGKLVEITIPESVTTLKPLAFYHCSSLEKAYVKANVTVLEDGVFYNPVYNEGGNTYTDTSLKSVYLSANITKIRSTALAGNFLTDIYFAGTEEQWNDLYFFNMVEDEKKPGEYKENRLEKSDVLSSSVKVTWDAEF